MSTTMLTLDGEPVSLRGARIALSMQFQDKDQSGQTSASTSSEQGEKAKELTVTGMIAFADEQQLTRLFELASSKGDGGSRHVYRIGSLLAKAVKIRQVKFAGDISATEQDGLMAWAVQFTLREYHSVPEKREQRQANKEASVAQGTENTVSTASADTTPGSQDLTWFEQQLKKADDYFA